MQENKPSYRRAFLRSRTHLWLALGTLGLGFASGEPLGLIVGLVAYLLGHIYLPDTASFRRSIDGKARSAEEQASRARDAAFAAQRNALMASLSDERRARHDALSKVCRDISAASEEPANDALALSAETRLRKLDELLWTYLRLLTIEQSLEVYLETERREQLSSMLASVEAEVATLEKELATAPKGGATETRAKLLTSKRDRLDALRQRAERVAQARANVELARSEQERLVEQAKLIRADAVAHKNAEALGARIDLSIEHLAETNRWLAELAEFKDLTHQMPSVSPGVFLKSTAEKSGPTAEDRSRTSQT